ncbi:TetR/AcrR family transcriptional regulator [Amycolatopsis minnesotensis]|uniref:TetR/AcrR family transcriptional regulator n=1 Tax=Amycolatopsis minnesotensis TaxID=337894 RepID=A0ABN2SPC0_9PSEU
MPKGPTKRRPQTRARLLDAALEAFAELGFGGATIDEICRRAGYTTGAYYSNFGSKDELFFALFDQHAESVIERVTRALDAAPPSPEQIGELFSEFGDEERRWFLVSTEFTLYAIRHPEAARRLADHDAKIRAELVIALRELCARMGRRPSVDIGELARMLIAAREGALLQSFVEPEALPLGTLERTFLPILFDGASEPVSP